MGLINFMEDVVRNCANEAISGDPDFCRCERCRLDVIAIALNHLHPKYVVSNRGYAYARMDELQAQFRTDTIVAVARAMKTVKERPLHKQWKGRGADSDE